MYADKSGLVTAALAVGVKQRGNATAAGRNAGARFSRRAPAAPRRAAASTKHIFIRPNDGGRPQHCRGVVDIGGDSRDRAVDQIVHGLG